MVLWRLWKLCNAGQQFSAKLAPKFQVSFEVIQQWSPMTYELKTDNNRRTEKAHVTDLERYLPPRNFSLFSWFLTDVEESLIEDELRLRGDCPTSLSH